jgi:hypothetical protein
MDPQEEAEFEALFTDEYWEQMRREAIEYYEDMRHFKQVAEQLINEKSEDRTNVRDTLLDKLTREAGQRPAYLTDVTSDKKELLRRFYQDILTSAKQCAKETGECGACGSTNLVGMVGVAVSKFKISVFCGDCDAMILWV